jgi:hypothetical protein
LLFRSLKNANYFREILLTKIFPTILKMRSNFPIIFSLYLSEFSGRKNWSIFLKCIKPPTKTTAFITIKECSHNLTSRKPYRVIVKILKITTYINVEIPKHSFLLVIFSPKKLKIQKLICLEAFNHHHKWKKRSKSHQIPILGFQCPAKIKKDD